MKDKIVQYPHRYTLTNISNGQVLGTYDMDKVEGTVTEVGTPINKGTMLSDTTATKYGVEPVSGTVNNVLERNAVGKFNSDENIAFLLASSEISGRVQPYSNFFYDVFYTGHSKKIGFIDNRYITYTGSISSGITSLNSANMNFTNFPTTSDYQNTNYMEYTIDDGTNREIVYIKNLNLFDSSSYLGTYPATVNITTTGTYYINMKGGKGSDSGWGTLTAYGGKGGTLKFKGNFTAGDSLVISKVDGGGDGIKVTKNGTTIAVVGGGGDSGGMVTPMYSAYNGGDGGTSTADNGTGTIGNIDPAGQGAVNGTGGASYIGFSPYVGYNGYNSPDGRGGQGGGSGTYKNWGTRGGGGYAGGGGGGYYGTDSIIGAESAGGGSSYLEVSYTSIENSKGTNNAVEYISISLEKYDLKSPLTNSYTNPTIYRSNLNIDTTNHRATIKPINGIYVDECTVRIVVNNNIEQFSHLSSWWEVTSDVNCISSRSSFGNNQNIDESINTNPNIITYNSGSFKSIRLESGNSSLVNNAVLNMTFNKVDDNAFLYKMYGVVN